MHNRSTLIAAAVAVAGLLATAPTVHGWMNASRLTYLTFSGPVALPGVHLAAGTYAFELADPYGDNSIVRVRSRNKTDVYFLGFTERVARATSVTDVSAVTFGEASRGEARPIVAWYPPDSSDGRRFIYR
jgi:hypothetical protein